MKKKRKWMAFFRQRSYLFAAALMMLAVCGMGGAYFFEQTGSGQGEKKGQAPLVIQEGAQEELAEVDQVIWPQNSDFMDEPDAIDVTAAAGKQEETQDTQQKQLGQAGEGQQSPGEKEEKGQEQAANAEAGEEKQKEEQKEETAQTLTTGNTKQLHFDAGRQLNWPLQGNVILNYSMDQTVYFATLDQYKYNPALVIQAKQGEQVKSVAEGKISHIETNEVTGTTVTVEMGDGYSAVYGQLKDVAVHAGDYVQTGEVLGLIEEPTKYYSTEGPNLYFELIKNNESIDPMEFLE